MRAQAFQLLLMPLTNVLVSALDSPDLIIFVDGQCLFPFLLLYFFTVSFTRNHGYSFDKQC